VGRRDVPRVTPAELCRTDLGMVLSTVVDHDQHVKVPILKLTIKLNSKLNAGPNTSDS
jgi:hypothetical protein